MADTDTETTEPAATAEPTDTPEVPAGAANPDAVQNALKTERAAAKEARKRAEAAEARLAEREEADKSELEKAQGKVAKTEERANAAEAKLLRFEVAAEKQIPAEALDLLNGATREDLEAAADKILELVKNRTEKEPTPDFDGGPREPAEDTDPVAAHNQFVVDLMGKRNT